MFGSWISALKRHKGGSWLRKLERGEERK